MDILLKSFNDIKDFDEIALIHWKEFNTKQPEFNKAYLSLLNAVVAEEAGKTKGYVLFGTYPSPYYNEQWGQIDMFFLIPEYRNKGVGKQMFRLVEQTLKQQGCKNIVASFNLKLPLDSFYSNMGYSQTHTVMGKEI